MSVHVDRRSQLFSARTLPILGPPGRPGPPSYIGMLAVFVRTDVPSYIVATSF